MYKPPSRSLRKPNVSDDDKNSMVPKAEEVPNAVNNSSVKQNDVESSAKSAAKPEPTKKYQHKPTEFKLGTQPENVPETVKKPAEIKTKPVNNDKQKPVDTRSQPVKKVEEKPVVPKVEPVRQVVEKPVVSNTETVKKVEEKPVEMKVNGVDKKTPEPVANSPSKKVTFRANTYKKSILERYKPGDVLQIGTEVENEDASRLFGMILDDADFEYLCNEMPNDIQKLDTYKKGEVVIVKHEQVPTRAIITDITADKVCLTKIRFVLTAIVNGGLSIFLLLLKFVFDRA